MKAIFIRLSRVDVGIALYDKCRKIMLRRGMVRAQSVGVDVHTDPRAAETIVGSLLGELSAKLTEGFVKRLILTPPSLLRRATSPAGESRKISASKPPSRSGSERPPDVHSLPSHRFANQTIRGG